MEECIPEDRERPSTFIYVLAFDFNLLIHAGSDLFVVFVFLLWTSSPKFISGKYSACSVGLPSVVDKH